MPLQNQSMGGDAFQPKGSQHPPEFQRPAEGPQTIDKEQETEGEGASIIPKNEAPLFRQTTAFDEVRPGATHNRSTIKKDEAQSLNSNDFGHTAKFGIGLQSESNSPHPVRLMNQPMSQASIDQRIEEERIKVQQELQTQFMQRQMEMQQQMQLQFQEQMMTMTKMQQENMQNVMMNQLNDQKL